MHREYDEETLKRVQELELGIFKEFIQICEENKLTYWVYGGTQIGVLRHEGFIPWDDDIDVILPRADYEKFLEIANRTLSDRYNIINAENYENCPLVTTWLSLKGTTFVQESMQGIKHIPFGIFLDIYPFDNAHDDDRLMRKQAREAWFWGKLLILRCVAKPYVNTSQWKRKIIHIVTACIHYAMRLFKISSKYLYMKSKNASMRYNHIETKRMGYFCDTKYDTSLYSMNEIYPLQDKKFEDIMVKFPNNPHQNLTVLYGDYMQMPPIEKRKNHFPFQLDFGMYGKQE